MDDTFYPISRLMWYEDVAIDKYWNALQYSTLYSKTVDFFNAHDSFSNRGLVRSMFKYKKEANSILKNNASFSSRKFYK